MYSGYITNLPSSIHPISIFSIWQLPVPKGGGLSSFVSTCGPPWPVPASFAERLDNPTGFPERWPITAWPVQQTSATQKTTITTCGKDLLYLPKHSTSLNQETAASPMPSVITTERPILKSQGGPESGVSTDPLTNETGNRLLATWRVLAA